MPVKTIVVSVKAREYIPGTVRTTEYEFCDEIGPRGEAVIDTSSKMALLNLLRHHFGRCVGRIPLGYRFEGVNRADDGSARYWETEVVIVSGARPVPGFDFE